METFKIILLTVAVCVLVKSQETTGDSPIQIPKPKITLNPTHKVLYSTETVTLHCEVPGRASELEYDWYKDSANLETDHQSNITVTNGGNYECKAKNGTSESEKSDVYTLTLQEPPEPKLSIESEWKTFYPTEKVTLKCSSDGGSNEWGYEWFRNGDLLSDDQDISFPGNTLLISSAKESHSGQFTCRGKHLTRTPVTTRQTEALKLHIYVDTPKPHVRKDQWFEFFYTEEKIQLGCNMPGDGWKYDWYKDSKPLNTDPTFTISSASLSNAGVYHCKAKRGNFSVDSETLQVQVQEPPQPKLSIESEWKSFYPTEIVTLKCSIDGGSNEWGYEWFRNGARLSGDEDVSFSENTLLISSAKESHSGQFTCRGKHLTRTPVTTRQTEALKLHIYGSAPEPDITKHKWFKPLYTGEKIQLGCNMTGDGWKYDWYKDSKQTEPLNTDPILTIRSASPTNTGVYHCKAKRADFSVDSETLQVQVQELPQPKLSIESEWKTFYPSEKVILKCSINSNEWGYEWFRNGARLSGDGDISFSANTLLISSAKESHSGQFTCRGKHLTRTQVTTRQTEALKLHIYGNTPKPDITKHKWFEFFYTGEKVQLGCNIPGDGWKYDWYKDSKPLNTDPIFTISSASLSDAGVYHCKAKRADFSVDSETLKVQVQEPPQPKLTIESKWKTFYPTERVTLKCSINSNEWGYEWFRNGARLSGDGDISFSGNMLLISSAKASHSGQFNCRGKHLTRTPVTRQTEALGLHIFVDTPKPNVRKDQWFEFFYTEEKVQLGCNMPGDGWKYDWYKDSKPLNTDPSFTISSASLSDAGVYHCKAKRGDFSVDSETLQVQVQARPPAVLSLETELSDIMSGNILTLRCNVSDGRQWSYAFYENGQKLNGSSDVFKVTATEETIKSEFKCKGIRTERPLYSAWSEGFTANNIILKRKILLAISGCLVCCIVILIIGCLVLRITRKPEKKPTAPEDLFFSMADSKNQTASPLEEYMDNSPAKMDECEEKEELLTDHVSAVHVDHVDGVIKDEDSPAAEANGLTSFKGL